MQIDEKIAREFVSGDITAKAFRLYLNGLFDKKEDTTGNIDFSSMAKEIYDAAQRGKIRLDNWESTFVSDNEDNKNPTEGQFARMVKIHRRIAYSME